jgi:geranylgeranyl diphosphate synthase type II
VDLKTYMAQRRELVDKALEQYIPEESKYPPIIHQAMRYSVFAGGKRLRPILTLAATEAVGGNPESVLFAACAIELIHTYSLIHDDLPSMDNDDFRRNKPTNHKVFGENMAILAGDALLTLAFEVLSQPENLKTFKAETLLSAIHEISLAAGTLGMIGGQVMDILSEGKRDLDPKTLEYIHTHKTGKLLLASLRVGALLANANAEQLKAITEYGTCIGLCFQIVDDILDVEGTTEETGKDVRSDAAREKATYPALYGLEKSKKLAQELAKKAQQALVSFGESAQPLRELGEFIVSRTY